jgi:hypothetical protein
MRTLLISTTAVILLLSTGLVSAQNVKTDRTSGAPTAQQNSPAEKMAPVVKSDQIKTSEKAGQAGPSEANGSAVVKSERTARHVGTHYADRRHGPLYDSYPGDPDYYASAWGCAHGSSNGNFGVGYAHRTQADAKSVALAICEREGGSGCYIISCSPKAETEAQAQTIWPQAHSGPGSFHCGSPGEPNC